MAPITPAATNHVSRTMKSIVFVALRIVRPRSSAASSFDERVVPAGRDFGCPRIAKPIA